MIRKILKLAGLGFLIGIALATLISAFIGNPVAAPEELVTKLGSMRAARLAQTLLAGVFGAVCMGCTVLYEAERLPLAASTALHCVICLLGFYPIATFLCWCRSIKEVLIINAFQLVAFVIIWLIMYAAYRKEVRELNEMNKNKSPEEK